MTRLLVSMGLADGPGAPRRPRVRVVDADRGVVGELAFEAAYAPSPVAHQEATSASLTAEGLLLQPAHTELLWIDPRGLRIVRRVSHPLFHGVHSATESVDGTLVLTCAGIDSVLELSPSGELVRHHWLRAGRFADAYGGVTDFRTVDHRGFDPHSHHPNHALRVGDDLWVTCFETRECRTVGGDRSIALGEAIPHDGVLRQGLLWFTQVDGHVVAVDPISLERRVVIDLSALTKARGLLGWCRGVEVVGSRMFVGMTMLRASRHREVLRMLLRGEDGAKLPTRLVEVDLDRRRIVRETELGNAEGGTIYSVVAPSDAVAERYPRRVLGAVRTDIEASGMGPLGRRRTLAPASSTGAGFPLLHWHLSGQEMSASSCVRRSGGSCLEAPGVGTHGQAEGPRSCDGQRPARARVFGGGALDGRS